MRPIEVVIVCSVLTCSALASKYALGDFVIYVDETNTSSTPLLQVTTKDGTVVWKSQETRDIGQPHPLIGSWVEPPPLLPFVAVATAKVTKGPITNAFYVMEEKVDASTKTDGVQINHVVASDKEVSIWGSMYRQDDPKKKNQVGFHFNFSNPMKNTLRKSGLSLDFNVMVDVGFANRVYLSAASPLDEKIYGMGVQYTSVNHKGKVLPIFISEQGVGRGLEPITGFLNTFYGGAGGNWHTSYACKPQFMTNMHRGAILFNTDASIFDWSSFQNQGVEVEIWGNPIEGRLFGYDSAMEYIEMITEYTGRMSPLPEWTQTGALLGAEGGQKEVEAIVNKVLAAGVNVTGLWLQDWTGYHNSYDGDRLQWNWKLDKTLYTDWAGLTKNMSKVGVKMLTYINPYFQSNLEGNSSDSQFSEGDKKGYFIKGGNNKSYPFKSGSINFGCLDMTNTDAVVWMKNIIKTEMIENADSYGWMSDFGEVVPFDTVLSNGLSGATHHNEFPEWWQKLNRETVDEIRSDQIGGREAVFFSRSAYNRSPKFADIFWLGDQLVTFDESDGLSTVVIAMQSGGLSGHSLAHSDIGAYTIVAYPFARYTRSAELLLRWIEMEAFSGSMYRTHVGSMMRTVDAQVWHDDVLPGFKKFTDIFGFLKGYREEAFQQAEKYGWPVVRSAFLELGVEDDRVWQADFIKNQYMFGGEFMVAPILEPGVNGKKVYYPQCSGNGEGGKWLSVWNDMQYNCGSEIWVPSKVGQPPVFFRENSKWGLKLKEFVAGLESREHRDPRPEPLVV